MNKDYIDIMVSLKLEYDLWKKRGNVSYITTMSLPVLIHHYGTVRENIGHQWECFTNSRTMPDSFKEKIFQVKAMEERFEFLLEGKE